MLQKHNLSRDRLKSLIFMSLSLDIAGFAVHSIGHSCGSRTLQQVQYIINLSAGYCGHYHF